MPNVSVGHLQNFVEGDNFVEYLMQADFFFEANKITSDDEKRALLLTAIGKKTFSLLRNLLQPREMKTVPYNEIIKVLTDYYSPASSIIMERFRFYNLKQGNEDIATFIVKIKELASKCNFGAFLNDALRDKLVCGLQSEQIQNKLLSEKDIDFAKASEMALAMETASRETKSLEGDSLNVFKIHSSDKVKQIKFPQRKGSGKPSFPHQGSKETKLCRHCGKSHRGECNLKNATCYQCCVKGHSKPVCKASNTNFVETGTSISDQSDFYLNNIDVFSISGSLKPYTTDVDINGVKVTNSSGAHPLDDKK
ncbi:hypothetical protein AVEN_122174-1 [Araneus ventricosus]|uniref:Retrotransposon gag domain-containing protein n=1 Tax=Araneus ventricosus TaxID=182803 RepID=A0A4Y2WPK5_ARAVE|nr:hypothetical protein AVEN_122174-1 [Araneus ventricosus]